MEDGIPPDSQFSQKLIFRADEDDIPMPEGLPPGSELVTDDDDIPMPDGPPPGHNTVEGWLAAPIENSATSPPSRTTTSTAQHGRAPTSISQRSSAPASPPWISAQPLIIWYAFGNFTPSATARRLSSQQLITTTAAARFHGWTLSSTTPKLACQLPPSATSRISSNGTSQLPTVFKFPPSSSTI